MDISAIILFEQLQKKFPVSRYGNLTAAPLMRPVFYSPDMKMEPGRIYVSRPDSMPPLHSLAGNQLLICAEGRPSLSYFNGRVPLFVMEETSVMNVFNALLAIFEYYEKWDNQLQQELNSRADIAAMLELTFPLVQNDLTVIDAQLRIVAGINIKQDSDGKQKIIRFEPSSQFVPIALSGTFRDIYEQNQQKRKPYYCFDGKCYCINLYLDEEYVGNLSLNVMLEPLTDSDVAVMNVLAGYLRKAFRIRNRSKASEKSRMNQSLLTLFGGTSLSPEQAAYLNSVWKRKKCFCFQVDHAQLANPFPSDYLSQALSEQIPGCFSFEYEGHTVGILFAEASTDCLSELSCHLRELGLTAGVSIAFFSPEDIRFHYLQAQTALELGRRDERTLHCFEDYALTYMLHGCSGLFPARLLCPPGLLNMISYQEKHSVDYLGTLRCFLDEERNIANTARKLDIHRNTLIQRITKIQQLLGFDLEKPENRLWLQLSIYLYEAEKNQ